MITTQIFNFEPQALNDESAYASLAEILPHLASAHPNFSKWWLSPRSPKDIAVPFADKSAVLQRLDEIKKKRGDEFPGADDNRFTSILVTTADNDREWKRHGRVSLSFAPGEGKLRLSIGDKEKTYSDQGALRWSLLVAVSKAVGLRFANCNVQQRVDDEHLVYSTDRAVFPHRQFLGWMGYIPESLTQDQVPAAMTLQPSGEGTLIRSTGLLDLADQHAIKQANQVEMSLTDLGLLPVVDPTMQ